MRFYLKPLACFFALFVMGGSARGEDASLKAMFTERNTQGTIVMASLDDRTGYEHNSKRAQKMVLPTSTFKIINSLIALNEGAVSSEKEVIAWDGTDKDSPWSKR